MSDRRFTLKKLEDWRFNVMLECTRSDPRLEMAVGGAILDLRDLEAILDAVVDFLPEPKG